MFLLLVFEIIMLNNEFLLFSKPRSYFQNRKEKIEFLWFEK